MFKSLNLSKKLTPLVFILALGFFMTSCGDDEITGCTDPTADNYNPEATISGNCDFVGCTDVAAENYDAQATISGDCIYARDKFVGSYVGTFTCSDPLLAPIINSDSLVFSITEGVNDDVSNVVISLSIDGFPIPLRATIMGDEMTVSDRLEGVMIPDIPLLGTITADVIGSGSATFSESTNTLDGDITITIDSEDLLILNPVMDMCGLVGVKQE